MITAVTGTPGAGKGIYCVRKCVAALESGKVLVTNVPFVADWTHQVAYHHFVRRAIPGRRAKLAREFASRVLYIETLEELQRIRVKGDDEGRWIVVIDEAGDFLDSRNWRAEGRTEQVGWFNKHRHYGADVYLVVQDLENIDRQVRSKAEYETTLRNLRRMKFCGVPLAPFNLFLAITRWNDRARSVAKRESYVLNWTKDLYRTHGAVDMYGAPPDALWLPRAPDDPTPGPPARSSGGGPLVDPLSLSVPPVIPE